MNLSADIAEYNSKQSESDREICAMLASAIEANLAEAEGKVWHGHPVWFIEGNPVVGYHLQKAGIRILFWSGQSFGEAVLEAVGKFKAAGAPVASLSEFDWQAFVHWLNKARDIQWDYQNLPKKRVLEKLTNF